MIYLRSAHFSFNSTPQTRMARGNKSKSPRGQLPTAAGGRKANIMDRIRFFALLRAVEREAAAWGYHGDMLAEVETIPLVGNPQQQFDQCTIYVDVRPRPANEAERQLVKRLIRAAVLTSPTVEPVSTAPQSTTTKIARERVRRRVV